jgi:hypothetical protein
MVSVCEKPLSPSHEKTSFPERVATAVKVRKGFAAMAGERSAANTSSPS